VETQYPYHSQTKWALKLGLYGREGEKEFGPYIGAVACCSRDIPIDTCYTCCRVCSSTTLHVCACYHAVALVFDI
jgi:hypothetical protein